MYSTTMMYRRHTLVLLTCPISKINRYVQFATNFLRRKKLLITLQNVKIIWTVRITLWLLSIVNFVPITELIMVSNMKNMFTVVKSQRKPPRMVCRLFPWIQIFYKNFNSPLLPSYLGSIDISHIVVPDSPIRSYRPISEQPNSEINYTEQFSTKSKPSSYSKRQKRW